MAPRIKYPQLHDPAWLRNQYEVQKRTMYEIAADLGCSPHLVYYVMRKVGVTPRPSAIYDRKWRPKACRRCSEMFTPSGPAGLYCSARCARNRPHDCGACGVTFWAPVGRAPKWTFYSSFLCSEECRAALSADRLDGKRRGYCTPEGYVRIPVAARTPGSFGPHDDTPWMLEHRFVMQEAVGRPLEPHETVHHINGDKADNRLANLQLRSGRHGTGVVLTCRSCGSHDVEASPLT